ncbi:hypothetical protein FCK90_06775 [Kocuria coralli]|uniref:Integral membrane bound transporter domain-containing protein n=1 Tax=Kocuria coralli TaxID=1461025 RepID=A0A5J5L0E2_9MICC|nr:FUSC family protein [Kocuria coralli]KAA9394516.1 hypothetical protein FCK90_06775 [Kocuria coralli]
MIPAQAAAITAMLQIAAAWAGILLAGQWWIVFPLLLVSFFAAGMLRSVAIGISMRWLVITIIFLAFAEFTPTLAVEPTTALLYFAVGAAIMIAAQLLPPFSSRHSGQRRAVSAFYRQIAAGGPLGPALFSADQSLALLHRRTSGRELERLTQLVERGEQIAQLLLLLDNRSEEEARRWRDIASSRLSEIAEHIARGDRAPLPAPPAWDREAADPAESALMEAIDAAARVAGGLGAQAPSEERRAPRPWELVRAELRPRSPILHHALRLSIACVIAQITGMLVASWVGTSAMLAGHGFWVVVATALIVFPDYGDTFSRGIGRTIGTVLGALLGIGLSFLPQNPLLHIIILVLLFFGYLAFRSCGQAWTMFWVVAWIAALTPGPLGAITRGADTLIGCVIGFAVFLVAPTWHRNQLSDRLKDWSQAEGERLESLSTLWQLDSEEHRLAVAHATVRSRVARLEFFNAAHSARTEPRSKREQWENDDLDPVSDRVLEVSRQVAVLSVSVPQWPEEARSRACSQADALATALRRLGAGEQEASADGGSQRIQPVRTEEPGGPGVADAQLAFTRAAEALDWLAHEESRQAQRA